MIGSGYTFPVINGEITTFEAFAMACARAFGACITMRDDPSDAVIPEAFEPDPYHASRLKEAQERERDLLAMTAEQKESAAKADHESALKRWKDSRDEHQLALDRCTAMLALARAWQPPSSDHQGLKSFMIEQLASAIDGNTYDTPQPRQQDADEWFAREMRSVVRDITYHTEEAAKESNRAKSRSAWIKELRASLSQTEAA